jgi:hypothetical protein
MGVVGKSDDHYKPVLDKVRVVLKKKKELLNNATAGIFCSGKPGKEL